MVTHIIVRSFYASLKRPRIIMVRKPCAGSECQFLTARHMKEEEGNNGPFTQNSFCVESTIPETKGERGRAAMAWLDPLDGFMAMALQKPLYLWLLGLKGRQRTCNLRCRLICCHRRSCVQKLGWTASETRYRVYTLLLFCIYLSGTIFIK